jgi:hypothetical protein
MLLDNGQYRPSKNLAHADQGFDLSARIVADIRAEWRRSMH